MTTDEQFQAIAREALEKMDAVSCSWDEFRDGLRGLIDYANLVLEASLKGDR